MLVVAEVKLGLAQGEGYFLSLSRCFMILQKKSSKEILDSRGDISLIRILLFFSIFILQFI